MSGRLADGSRIGEDDAPDEVWFQHHIFRLHGIPPHEVEQWEPGWKRVAYVSIGLQLQEENKRLEAGFGRVM
ncbi:hypothetical protein IR194_07740 [Exiguobacterium sp. PBE]|nr:hypothetical protein IR194_07740 [Exiguobacterium sp. PBE]